jgi:pyruvate dehydrogenase E2 component (dihydrolipoamide acetyltransferase)
MGEFRMPSLGADMEAGTLVEWRVRPGDVVKRGDIVALVETEKGIVEVEIFESGTIEAILVTEGKKVPVGTALARVLAGAEPGPAVPPREEKPASRIEEPAPTPPAKPLPAGFAKRVSPLARRKAEELGVDIATVSGTGERGAVTSADVERAAAPGRREGVPAQTTTTNLPVEMRRVIAAAMTRSKREIPHYYLATHMDMSRALAWLAEENLKRPVTNRLLYSVLLIRAVALALHEVPELNGFWVDGSFRPGAGVHVGLAISLRQGGLVAPAIHDADRKSLDELMRDMLDLVNRARRGVLRSSEMSDPTITVTNLGDQGVETVFGVIYPPQVALVGFGKLTERAWAAQGMVGARPVIAATLSADHRASDGHRGGRFLAAVDRVLQQPEKL